MEGRVSAAADIDEVDPSSSSSPAAAPPPSHAVRRSETYVIQIPKDQIYRVPPPENARVAERLRKPVSSKATKSSRRVCLCLLCMGITLLVMGFVFGLTLLVMFCSLSLKAPKFSVENVQVLNHPEYNNEGLIKNSSSIQSYAVYVKVDNTNSNTGISYQREGSVTSMTFRGKNIGKGTYPTMFQGGDFNSTTVRLVLDGSKGVHFKRDGDNNNNNKLPISLSLKLDIPIRMYVWILEIWKKEILVGCKVKLKDLETKNSKVIRGACHTKFRS
ncbi:NDR1/HIN1-like protein 13 [Humulus lupulus]|uniref:NDR1/HIN1-like protein 13 n=1 Tax=Humulus lupulus TaxID=3486 RepID=UPI002B40525F|nr:NDR1/HIN1-like protein 13 [Humulus lupulus]